MRFASLFPPVTDDGTPETCQFGALDDFPFSKIEQQELPPATFIDGGSAVLFSTPTRCIGIIKLALVRTEGLQRKEITHHQYLVSITLNASFVVKCQPLLNADERVTACLDCELPLEPDLTPEKLLDPLRTLAEYAIAPDGIVVHDGSLRTTNALVKARCISGQAVALAKTSGLVTSRHRPLSFALLQRAPAGAWICRLSETISCVRLHAAASHVFLLEGNVTPQTLSLLAAWSNDLAFPGYPYPLVLADQLARVTNNERDTWRLVISSDKEASAILSSEMKATDAHAMLEHILYGKEF